MNPGWEGNGMTAEKRDKTPPAPGPSQPAVQHAGQPPQEPTAAERPPSDGPAFEEAGLWEHTFDALPDLIAILDTQHRITRVNKALADRLGLTKDQCVGRTCFSCVHATDGPPAFCPQSQLLQDGHEHSVEMHEEKLGGDFFVSVSPLRDSAGNLAGSVHVVRDIACCKRAEKAMRAKEEHFHALLRSLNDGIWAASLADREMLYVNPAVERIYERSLAEIRANFDFWKQAVHPEDHSIVEASQRRLFDRGDAEAEFRILRPDGEVRWIFTRKVLARDDLGNATYVGGVVNDVTERKQAEQALERLNAELEDRVRQRTVELAESEERYRRLFHESTNAICVNAIGPTAPMRFLEVNDVAVRLLGYLLGMTPPDVEAPDSRQDARPLTERLQRGETVTFQRIVVAKDGRRIPLEVCCKPFLWQGELRAFSQARDITERKQAEEALRQSEERFRLTFDQSPIGVAMVSLDYRYMRVNEMFCRITGYTSEELTRLRFTDITHPDNLAEVVESARCLVAGEIDHYELDKRFLRKDGGVIWTRLAVRMMKTASGEPLYFLPTMQDITDHKRAEEALRRSEKIQAEAEKLAATGRMAAQVAHEINNPLAGIKSAFRLIRDAVPQDHPDRDMVKRIEREIDRITRVVRQMYELYSPQAQTPREILVGETICDVLTMLEPLCREHEVAIEMGPVPSCLMVWAPDGSLQQVLYNLTVNAIQASPRGGIVNIATNGVDKDIVRISIRDHGHGIPAQLKDRVFESFFSAGVNDATDQRLGLGLSIVKSIITSVGGQIEFESTVGEGTCFHVYLPSKHACQGVTRWPLDRS
jgi:PAS domain S-box-containing protein